MFPFEISTQKRTYFSWIAFPPENAGKGLGEETVPNTLLWHRHANMGAPMRAKLAGRKEMSTFPFLLSVSLQASKPNGKARNAAELRPSSHRGHRVVPNHVHISQGF
jgi:hypothetical protein